MHGSLSHGLGGSVEELAAFAPAHQLGAGVTVVLQPGIEQIARLRGPVGLAIGSRTPAEIAVAVAAELVAVRRKFEDERVGGVTGKPARDD